MRNFTDFKKEFYSRVKNPELFDCGDVNLLKVVLDGLKVDYAGKGKLRSFMFYPSLLRIFFERRRHIQLSKNFTFNGTEASLQAAKAKTSIVSDVGRIVFDANNKPKSLYFDLVVSHLNRKNTFIVADKINDKNQDFDTSVRQSEWAFAHLKMDEHESAFLNKIRKTFKCVEKSALFTKTELLSIQYAFHKFFYEYKVWRRVLQQLPGIRTCYFICHYHKEGQIYALKSSHVECVELQHGLIAPQDIFYVFPEAIKKVKSRALFADKILVYGNYWKTVLQKGVEYSDEQIGTIGYYLYNDFDDELKEKELKSRIGNRKVILITTQTFLHAYFIDFAKALAQEIEKAKMDVMVLIKPHPAEDPGLYGRELSGLKNIEIVTYPLAVLFKKTNLHVSIYSTTLYDALRYNLPNFVFKPTVCEDYVNEIVNTGIATEIKTPNEILNALVDIKPGVVDANLFYENFNPKVIQL